MSFDCIIGLMFIGLMFIFCLIGQRFNWPTFFFKERLVWKFGNGKIYLGREESTHKRLRIGVNSPGLLKKEVCFFRDNNYGD